MVSIAHFQHVKKYLQIEVAYVIDWHSIRGQVKRRFLCGEDCEGPQTRCRFILRPHLGVHVGGQEG